MTITQPRRRGVALAVAGLLTVGLMTSLSPQWAHADPPASPPDKAPTTTLHNLAIPAVATAKRESAQQKSSKQAQRQTEQPQTEQRQAEPRTSHQAPTNTTGSDESAAGKVIADLPATSTQQFSMVGVTWLPGSSGADEAKVQVRTRPVKGTWTDWTTLAYDADADPADATRVGTAPTFVGESNAVQVRVTGDTDTKLKDLQLTLIDSPVVASDEHPQTMAAEPQMATASSTLPQRVPRPKMISRKGWGADESLRTHCSRKYDKTIEAVVIHHTAGTNSYSKAQSASIVRGIYAYHTKTHGWCDIGYNFLVDRYGQIFVGRAGGTNKPVHGAHATKWNTDTSGISLMGNFDKAKPTSAMISATERLVAWKLEGYYRNPQSKVTLAGKTEYRIFSHGDVMQTDCPGKYVHRMLGAIRDNVKHRIGSYNTPIYRKWQSLGGESGWVGSPYVGETKTATGGRYTDFTRADIYYRSDTGTHYVTGAIRNAYNRYGDRTSPLGYPTSDMRKGHTPGSFYNHFNAGDIYWSKKTHAHAVLGGIGKKYRAMKGDASPLGLPTADEKRGPVKGAWMQTFTGGWLVWSSKTGTHELWGGLGKAYRQLSQKGKNALGVPSSHEYKDAAGTWVQNFTGGFLTWTSATGAQHIWGGIGDTYAHLSSARRAALGAPTSNEHKNSSGVWVQNFQHGSITWTHAKGGVVHYN